MTARETNNDVTLPVGPAPSDADPVREVLAPAQAPALLRRDAARRVAPPGFVAWAWALAAVCGLAPVAVLLVQTGASPPAFRPAQTVLEVDAAAVRGVLTGLVETQPAETAPAPPASSALAAVAGRSPEGIPDGSRPNGAEIFLAPQTIASARTLMREVAVARDKRRARGLSGAELKKPFTLDELGGAELATTLALGAGSRLLLSRDGALVAPAGATLPVPNAGTLSSTERDEDLLLASGQLGGEAVTVARRCLPFEQLCFLDILHGPPPRVAASTTATTDDAANRALRLKQATEDIVKLVSRTAPADVQTASAPAGVALHPLALASVVLAACAAAAGAFFAGRLARTLRVVAHRARLIGAGGHAPPATAAFAEVAQVEAALDDLGAALARAQVHETHSANRSAQLNSIADVLHQAAAATNLRLRPPALQGDDTELDRVTGAAVALLEALEERVIRLKSHADTAGGGHESAPRPGAEEVERRARALLPLPALLSALAERLLLLARTDGLPETTCSELRALGDAIGARARTVDDIVQGLVARVTAQRAAAPSEVGDRDDVRAANALTSLRSELGALLTSSAADRTLAALTGLPAEEIAARQITDSGAGVPPR